MPEPRATVLGATRKAIWGFNHLGRLEASINSFNAQHPTKVIAKVGPLGSNGLFPIRWSVEDYTLPDGNWPLIIGDALGCFRAALDHIVSERVRLERGLTVDAVAKLHLSFPISDSPAAFKRDTKKLREIVSSKFLLELEHAQIYTFDPQDVGDSFILTALRDLTNLDKHRGLPVTESCVQVAVAPNRPGEAPVFEDDNYKYLRIDSELGNLEVSAESLFIADLPLATKRHEAIYIPNVEAPRNVLELLDEIGMSVLALVGALMTHPGDFEPSDARACLLAHVGEWEQACQ